LEEHIFCIIVVCGRVTNPSGITQYFHALDC